MLLNAHGGRTTPSLGSFQGTQRGRAIDRGRKNHHPAENSQGSQGSPDGYGTPPENPVISPSNGGGVSQRARAYLGRRSA